LKKIILNHSLTPSFLSQINQDLTTLLLEQDPDESKFLELATKRDDLIQKHLSELDYKTKQEFVKAEIEVNGVLVASANQLFKASLNQLSGLVRGRKAVEKYK
jgi:hypothetical protein